MKMPCSRSMSNSCARLVNPASQSISFGYMKDQLKLKILMLTIKKLARLVFMSILPILLYEVAALTFWSYMIGTASLKHVHEIAWSQDLVIFLPVICIAMFGYHLYYL